MGTISKPTVLVITSCTGQKVVSTRDQLTWEDFAQGPKHVTQREELLHEYLRKAEQLYSGQQHIRLRRGLQAARKQNSLLLSTYIVSAGYGLIAGSKRIAPYESTFNGLKKHELLERAKSLDIPKSIARLLSKQYDLVLLLLGDCYLQACSESWQLSPASPTLMFCGREAEQRVAKNPHLRTITLGNEDAHDFSCSLVGLKGELAGRLLDWVAQEPARAKGVTRLTREQLLRQLSKIELPPLGISVGDIDQRRPEINIPANWSQHSKQKKLRYFIPDWDDRVDPDYDFIKDERSNSRGSWVHDAYAHELYESPNYDGLLVSKIVAEKGNEKRQIINALGVHRYLRVPKKFPVMGDCGAFGYIHESKPPFSTQEMLEYYSRLGFDLGVSVDHLILAGTEEERRARYELTIANAAEFLREHKKMNLQWEPIGAVQGWNPETYAKAVTDYVKMGYRHVALGGLVRSTTPDILAILEQVHTRLRPGMKLHLFGLSRFKAVEQFVNFGVTSVDSASMLRKAWLGSHTNFLSEHGWYSAIRVPQLKASFRAKQAVLNGASSKNLATLERECLEGLHRYGLARKSKVDPALLNSLSELDLIVTGEQRSTIRDVIRHTLEDRPWEHCGCAVCISIGIDVVIFRGNNRNRRRGFHNTYVFYRLMERLMGGEKIDWLQRERNAK